MIVLLLVCCYGVGIGLVFAVAVIADFMVGRRFRIPERWCVPIPGRFPAYVRQDYARARKALARSLKKESP